MNDKHSLGWQSIHISALYLAAGTLWILFSDRLAALFSGDKDALTVISTYKGWFYVLITAVLLYYLLNKAFKKIALNQSELLESNNALKCAQQELETRNKELEYYAEHDTLTGLYNRRLFKEMLEDLDGESTDIGILYCDIDGLKLINETLGNESGDKLLVSFAEIFISVCPKHSFSARVGGDEFAVIMIHTNKEELNSVTKDILNCVKEFNTGQAPIHLSVSVGTAFRKSPSKNGLEQTLKEAEEEMNFHKILRSQSKRSKMVDLMMNTLNARDYITEGHTDRLQKLVEMIAEKTALSEPGKSRLSLFARFHDIGKVGIPDSILFKPGALTASEREDMKKHSEIGYRIANSSPDLIPISDLILKHHEWWNGQGYPFGLSGDDIPLECRILAIADAYDCMCNDRPYRKALPFNERIAELLRFSGSQFDPHLLSIFISVFMESHAS